MRFGEPLEAAGGISEPLSLRKLLGLWALLGASRNIWEPSGGTTVNPQSTHSQPTANPQATHSQPMVKRVKSCMCRLQKSRVADYLLLDYPACTISHVSPWVDCGLTVG